MPLPVIRNKRIVTYVALVVLSIFIIIAVQGFSGVSRFFSNVRVGFYNFGNLLTNIEGSIFKSKALLQKENQDLQDQLLALAFDRIEYEEFKTRIVELEANANYHPGSNLQKISASVLARSREIDGQELLIDQGTAEGVSVGDAAVVMDGIYLGKVVSTEEHVSSIQLLTDDRHKVAVTILQQNNTLGIAEGQGGVLLEVSYIPQSVDIFPDALVVTSTLNPGIPSGLIVGTVNEVIQDEHDPFQSAFVEPLINVQRVTSLEIIHSPDL